MEGDVPGMALSIFARKSEQESVVPEVVMTHCVFYLQEETLDGTCEDRFRPDARSY